MVTWVPATGHFHSMDILADSSLCSHHLVHNRYLFWWNTVDLTHCTVRALCLMKKKKSMKLTPINHYSHIPVVFLQVLGSWTSHALTEICFSPLWAEGIELEALYDLFCLNTCAQSDLIQPLTALGCLTLGPRYGSRVNQSLGSPHPLPWPSPHNQTDYLHSLSSVFFFHF